MSGDNRASALQDDTWLEAVSASLPGIMWTTDRDLRVVTCQGSTQHAFPGRAGLLVRGQLLQELFATADPEYPPLVAHRRALEGEVCPLVFTETDWTFCGRVGPIRWNDEIVGCVALAGELFPCVRHESLAHTIRDLVLFLSPGGEIREISRTGGGLQPEHVLGRSIYDFVPAVNHEPLRAALDDVCATGRLAQLEVGFARRSGQTVWQSLRLGPVSLHGRMIGIVLVATDITPQKEALARLQHEETLLRDLLELQDRERRMVAYEIHDGFLQDVVGARMILQSVRPLLGGADVGALRRFDSAVSLLARAVNEGRRLISELRPMIIDEMGIVEAIEFLVGEEEAQGGMQITLLDRTQQQLLPPLLRSTLFRIVQEALRNARRHGQAEHVTIRLTQIGGHYFVLEIQDDGSGFDPDAVPADRYGLAGIRERAALFGGQATIESAPGRGTRITVKLALDELQESAADSSSACAEIQPPS